MGGLNAILPIIIDLRNNTANNISINKNMLIYIDHWIYRKVVSTVNKSAEWGLGVSLFFSVNFDLSNDQRLYIIQFIDENIHITHL